MVGIICLIIIFISSSASQQCSKSVRSITGKYLTGHVISGGSSHGLGDCLIKCSDVPQCRSINFNFPWDYGSRDGHAYSDYPFKVNHYSTSSLKLSVV